jgi:predicted transcriptional regulator
MEELMDVLLSIKPQYAKLIFDGTKIYEYRKTIFSRPNIKKVVVYASTPTQKVIGEFEIEKIIHDNIHVLWEHTREQSGLTEESFFRYFINNQTGYAIKIKTNNRYETPLPLEHFTSSSPPQSFIYI